MDAEDIGDFFFRANALKINSPEDLDDFGEKLEKNFIQAGVFLQNDDRFENCILDMVYEDAVCSSFSEEIIRRALELGYYPMAMRGRVYSFDELDDSVLGMENCFGREEFVKRNVGKGIFRAVPTVRYHAQKLIIRREDLHVSKKFNGWIRNKFSDYSLSFNKNFDLCMEELVASYPDTWLYPPLVRILKSIHENPGTVSVDSVEIWHGDELVAGEIGFITKNAYASLSGFHKEDDIGTVQMCALGKYLFENGFAYWDLGMEIEYKYRFGAKACDRRTQKKIYSLLSDKKKELPEAEIPLTYFI